MILRQRQHGARRSALPWESLNDRHGHSHKVPSTYSKRPLLPLNRQAPRNRKRQVVIARKRSVQVMRKRLSRLKAVYYARVHKRCTPVVFVLKLVSLVDIWHPKQAEIQNTMVGVECRVILLGKKDPLGGFADPRGAWHSSSRVRKTMA